MAETTKHRRQGFTLIELSIVLLIIGLIVGGILAGSEMIEVARQRHIISEHEKFATTWNTFKLKYKCLPGDCPYATRFWGQAGCTSNADFDDTSTCDGDGNGLIFWSIGAMARETSLVWNHLFRADLSKYLPHNGITTAFTAHNTNYVLAPNKNNTIVWLLGNSTVGGSWAQMYASSTDDNLGSALRGVGLQTTRMNSVGSQPRVAVEPPFTVEQLDKKMDDGIPAAGKFRASGGFAYGTGIQTTCITGSGSNSAYDLTQADPTCRYVYSIE